MGGAVQDFSKSVSNDLGKVPVIGRAAQNIWGVGSFIPASTDRMVQGVKTLQNAPRDAAAQAAAAQKIQSDAASKAAADLALKPKLTASDNFLANKNRTLQNMRLGLQSSVGGSAGAAAPSLSAPSLTGKSKLGA